MIKGIKLGCVDGSNLKIGIAVATWNDAITSMLRDRCLQALGSAHVRSENIATFSVPGAFELPFAAKQLIKKEKVDAVVVLGCLIKGETMHFEYIAQAVSQGVMRVGLETGVPVIFGVLTCLTESQAKKRAAADGLDHGFEWGLSAVAMGSLVKKK